MKWMKTLKICIFRGLYTIDRFFSKGFEEFMLKKKKCFYMKVVFDITLLEYMVDFWGDFDT